MHSLDTAASWLVSEPRLEIGRHGLIDLRILILFNVLTIKKSLLNCFLTGISDVYVLCLLYFVSDKYILNSFHKLSRLTY